MLVLNCFYDSFLCIYSKKSNWLIVIIFQEAYLVVFAHKLAIFDRSVFNFLKSLYHFFYNSVDPDQLASFEVSWSGSTLFYINTLNLYK